MRLMVEVLQEDHIEVDICQNADSKMPLFEVIIVYGRTAEESGCGIIGYSIVDVTDRQKKTFCPSKDMINSIIITAQVAQSSGCQNHKSRGQSRNGKVTPTTDEEIGKAFDQDQEVMIALF